MGRFVLILISHRGNLNGKTDRENQPEYINEALDQGFDVEVDVWDIFGSYFLGHDEPQYLVKKEFLKNDKLWCHAKNIQGLYSMMEDDIHCFWHQEDDVTLTSKGYLWTYPGKQLTKKSIMVVIDNSAPKLPEVTGVCSDYIGDYNE
jgi:hypothetical protein